MSEGDWKSVETFTARIYIAGDIATAEAACREYCFDVGLCVTVEPTRFIYTGGDEIGFVIGLVNYPRFPAEREEIRAKAKQLAVVVMERCFQWSALIVSTDRTEWITRRKPEEKS